MVLLSITPLPDGVLQLDIIAPFHTSGPPLLQFHLDIEQWGYLQKQAEKWIYPIPVLEAFIATKTCISNNHSAAGYVGYWTWDKDITTEYAYSWNNYPSYCFMIGKV